MASNVYDPTMPSNVYEIQKTLVISRVRQNNCNYITPHTHNTTTYQQNTTTHQNITTQLGCSEFDHKRPATEQVVSQLKKTVMPSDKNKHSYDLKQTKNQQRLATEQVAAETTLPATVSHSEFHHERLATGPVDGYKKQHQRLAIEQVDGERQVQHIPSRSEFHHKRLATEQVVGEDTQHQRLAIEQVDGDMKAQHKRLATEQVDGQDIQHQRLATEQVDGDMKVQHKRLATEQVQSTHTTHATLTPTSTHQTQFKYKHTNHNIQIIKIIETIYSYIYTTTHTNSHTKTRYI